MRRVVLCLFLCATIVASAPVCIIIISLYPHLIAKGLGTKAEQILSELDSLENIEKMQVDIKNNMQLMYDARKEFRKQVKIKQEENEQKRREQINKNKSK